LALEICRFGAICIPTSFLLKPLLKCDLLLKPSLKTSKISFPQILEYHERKDKVKDFQDGCYREEAESMPPKVKSWRDAGDTPCRQGH
jgi:hypothetical protein